MKTILAAAAFSVGAAGPLAAQTRPEPAQSAPAVSPPAAAAPEQADPVVERQRKSAAKLAGMIRFVAVSCPEAEPDYERFKAAIAAMKVDIKELEDGPLLGESLGYSRAYDKDKDESCKRVFAFFGENGTTIPGLVGRKKTP